MRLALCVVLLAAAAPLSAQIEPILPSPSRTAQGDVAITIYNEDRALIQDRRELTLPAGRSKQDFPDVSAQILPETVTLTGDGLGIVEQNFDFDLLTPAALRGAARRRPADAGYLRPRP